MRVWFLCLLASGLLIGCHHDPPITFDEDKASGHQIVVPDDQTKQNENKNGGSDLH